jgi:hypothetical protein
MGITQSANHRHVMRTGSGHCRAGYGQAYFSVRRFALFLVSLKEGGGHHQARVSRVHRKKELSHR